LISDLWETKLCWHILVAVSQAVLIRNEGDTDKHDRKISKEGKSLYKNLEEGNSLISNDALIKEENETIDIDEYLFRTGECGPYQVCIVIQMMIIALPLVFPPLLFYFIGHDPQWISRKVIPEYEVGVSKIKWVLHRSDDNGRCKMNRNEWTYYYSKTTMATEFDLVCEDSWLLALSGSSVFIGWGIGSILMGYLSDVYGRKAVFIPGFIIDLTCILLHYFIKSVWLLILVRFIMGVFHAGPALNYFILVIELIGPNYRVLAANCANLTWVFGSVIMTIKAYLIDDWRTLCLALSVPYYVCVLLALSFPESVRWLNLHGKLKEAEKILQRASMINQRPLQNVSIKAAAQRNEKIKYSYFDLFSTCKVTMLVLNQGFVWMNSGIVYYTLSWAFADIGGDLYINFMLSIAVEVPMHLLAIIFLQKYGRKRTTIWSFIVSCLSCLAVAMLLFFEDVELLRLGVALLGKCAIALGFLCIYMWSSEIYPTVVRTQGMGFNIITSRTGAALSPFVKLLEHIHPSVPFFLMTVTTFITVIFCLFLPETLGKPTREKFEDLTY